MKKKVFFFSIRINAIQNRTASGLEKKKKYKKKK